jgi:hypothetical protein
VYSSFAFSIFYRSLVRMDKAYAFGVSGGNGWQRLFEGTRLQYVFDWQPEKEGYGVLMDDSDGWSSEGSDEKERRVEDLEAAWINDLGIT